jgi:hypothetical protein
VGISVIGTSIQVSWLTVFPVVTLSGSQKLVFATISAQLVESVKEYSTEQSSESK